MNYKPFKITFFVTVVKVSIFDIVDGKPETRKEKVELIHKRSEKNVINEITKMFSIFAGFKIESIDIEERACLVSVDYALTHSESLNSEV